VPSGSASPYLSGRVASNRKGPQDWNTGGLSAGKGRNPRNLSTTKDNPILHPGSLNQRLAGVYSFSLLAGIANERIHRIDGASVTLNYFSAHMFSLVRENKPLPRQAVRVALLGDIGHISRDEGGNTDERANDR
jgi:hypothetical protein